MTRSYVAFTDNMSRVFGVISVLLLISAMLVVCQMIFLRYFFRMPTIWQTDFVVYAATASIFLGAPYVLMKRAHVNVDVVENLLTGRARDVQRIIAKLLGLAFCAVMFAASASYVWEAWSLGWKTSSVWQIPVWIPALPMPVGFALICLQYAAEFLRPEGERP
ncbi:MAG: TRAP transporter small permease [Rhodomicrobium sp.]|nr:TRAP transporter small permease [Rhodomicrobium sp.]